MGHKMHPNTLKESFLCPQSPWRRRHLPCWTPFAHPPAQDEPDYCFKIDFELWCFTSFGKWSSSKPRKNLKGWNLISTRPWAYWKRDLTLLGFRLFEKYSKRRASHAVERSWGSSSPMSAPVGYCYDSHNWGFVLSMLILKRCLKPMNPLFQPDNSWLRCVWGEGKHNVAILNKTIIIVQIINHRDNQSQDLHQITSEGIVWSQNFLAVMRWPDWGIRRRNIFDAANNDDQFGN